MNWIEFLFKSSTVYSSAQQLPLAAVWKRDKSRDNDDIFMGLFVLNNVISSLLDGSWLDSVFVEVAATIALHLDRADDNRFQKEATAAVACPYCYFNDLIMRFYPVMLSVINVRYIPSTWLFIYFISSHLFV